MEKDNLWELMEQNINDNLGYYGLEFKDKFLDLKEVAEDLNLCPADTYERQDRFDQMSGECDPGVA